MDTNASTDVFGENRRWVEHRGNDIGMDSWMLKYIPTSAGSCT